MLFIISKFSLVYVSLPFTLRDEDSFLFLLSEESEVTPAINH